MQTVTNYYISALALSDAVLALFCIPFQFRAALVQRWDLPEFMCQFCPFMQTLSVRLQMDETVPGKPFSQGEHSYFVSICLNHM